MSKCWFLCIWSCNYNTLERSFVTAAAFYALGTVSWSRAGLGWAGWAGLCWLVTGGGTFIYHGGGTVADLGVGERSAAIGGSERR